MNDRYITIPRRQVDPFSFYGEISPIQIIHIDRTSGKKYKFRFEESQSPSNTEVRLYQMREY